MCNDTEQSQDYLGDDNHDRPWYICPHGNDVSEWECEVCEFLDVD